MVESAIKKIYKVSDLTGKIKSLLELNLGRVWVEGEISNLRCPMSGHMYFTLKDDKSQISSVLFRGRQSGINFEPTDGMKVILYGLITVYEVSGKYQIIVDRMAVKGVGELQLAFEQLKKRLQEEGLFDEDRKTPIPSIPAKIGVITSPTGAVIRDIIHVISRRFSGVHMILNPVRVQGDGAAEDIASALDELNKKQLVDVIIVGRGGGSLEDLWAFNTEAVARAIARSKIPVISAVGHEIDFTISDFVADLRAPTPSAAAEMVIGKKEEYMKDFQNFCDQLIYIIKARVSDKRHRLQELISSHVFYEPKSRIRLLIQRVDECLARLQRAERHTLDGIDQTLKGLAGKLNALSPLNILARGYSVTTSMKNKSVCKTVWSVSRGDVIQTQVADGKFLSKITKVC